MIDINADYNLSHIERYKKWAPHYNKNVLTERKYIGHLYMVDFLLELSSKQQIDFSLDAPDLKILDVGCGTGLVGEVLTEKGSKHIDGVDFSQEMVDEAYRTGVYQSLIGRCDIRNKLPFYLHNQYNLTVSVGVFTLDMVMPNSLVHLIQASKKGGIIALNTRIKWYEAYDFKSFYEDLIQKEYLELIDCRMDAPYSVGNFNAHYWAFLVKNNQIE